MGGDEFIVVLSELTQAKDAAVVGSKVLQELARPFAIENHDLNISCSVGISVYPDDGPSLEQLMIRADDAMYHAKKAGRNAYRFFERGMDVLTSARATPH